MAQPDIRVTCIPGFDAHLPEATPPSDRDYNTVGSLGIDLDRGDESLEERTVAYIVFEVRRELAGRAMRLPDGDAPAREVVANFLLRKVVLHGPDDDGTYQDELPVREQDVDAVLVAMRRGDAGVDVRPPVKPIPPHLAPLYEAIGKAVAKDVENLVLNGEI